MNESIVVSGLVVSVVVALVGYLLKRAIDGVDTKLEALGTKVDGLATKDGQHSESIVELKVRMAHVEGELLQLQRSVQRRRSTDEAAT